MTDHDCTSFAADSGNILYPAFFINTERYSVAEDSDEYDSSHKPNRLSCETLNSYINHRLEDRKELPVRLHVLFDELCILLRQRQDIDVFDLLVELILLADQEPARHLSTMLAVLDENAIANLESNTIARTGAFIHDALQQDVVRWYLQNYHEEQQ